MKNKFIRILKFLFIFCTLPIEFSSIFPVFDATVITVIVNILRAGLVLALVFYIFKKKLKPTEISLLKKLSLYFLFILLLNIISSLCSNYEVSILVIAKRCLSIIYMFCFYAFIIYNYDGIEEILKDMKWACAISLIFSIAVYFIFPEVGRYYAGYGTYYLRGIMANRNGLIELALPMIAITLFTQTKIKWWDIVLILLSLVEIVMTGSATSLFAIAFFGIGAILGIFMKKHLKILFVILSTCVIAIWGLWCVLVMQNNNLNLPLANLLGKSGSLSGRTLIWEEAKKSISYNPVLGYGYDNTIMKDSHSELAPSYRFPNDTHNAALYIVLVSGIAGLIPLLLIGARLFKKVTISIDQSPKIYYLALYILSILIRGLAESCWSYPHLALYIFVIIIFLEPTAIKHQGRQKERIHDAQ